MDFLNVGGLELVFLLALTVVLVGPQKAIELTAQIGKFVAGARRAVNSIKDDLQAQLEDETAGLKEIERGVQATVVRETEVFRAAQETLRDVADIAEGSIKDSSIPNSREDSSVPADEQRD